MKKLNGKDGSGRMGELWCSAQVCELVCLGCPSGLMNGVERVIQALLFALWKQGLLKLKKCAEIPGETRKCSPPVSTVRSSVQNSIGTQDSVDFTGYSSLRIMGTSTGTLSRKCERSKSLCL